MPNVELRFIQDDGGRAAAGFNGFAAGDCVCRAIAIATKAPYREVYDGLNAVRDGMRQTMRVRHSSSRTGVTRPVYEKYLQARGWRFVPTMTIGSGCRVHLADWELPDGILICRLAGHLCAVVHGEIRDITDPRRFHLVRHRCVYGYYLRD